MRRALSSERSAVNKLTVPVLVGGDIEPSPVAPADDCSWISFPSAGSRRDGVSLRHLPKAEKQSRANPEDDLHVGAHGHVNHSFHDLSAVQKAARDFTRQQAKTRALQDRLLILRDRANFQWAVRYHHRRFVRESQREFMDEVTEFMGQFPLDARSAKLRSLYDQVIEDQDALERQAEESRTFEDDLSAFQYTVSREEAALASAAKSLLANLEETGLSEPLSPHSSPLPTSGTRSASSRDSSPPKGHPLLRQFFDKYGDVKVMHERIDQLSIEHEETLVRRTFQADHEVTLPISDEVFEAQYQRERELAVADLRNAIQAAELAEKVCLEFGIDLGQFRMQINQMAVDLVESPVLAEATPMPASPSTLQLETPEEAAGPLTMLALADTDRNESSTMLTIMTGPLHGDVYGPRQKKRDRAHAQARVADWVKDVEVSDQHATRDVWQQIEAKLRAWVPRSDELHSRLVGVLQQDDEPDPFGLLLRSQSEQYKRNGMYEASDTLLLKPPTRSRQRKRSSDSDLSVLQSRHDSHQDILKGLANWRH